MPPHPAQRRRPPRRPARAWSSREARSVGEEGLEPSRSCEHWLLRPDRLPFRHSPTSIVRCEIAREQVGRGACKRWQDMVFALLNVLIRLHVAYFLWEVMANPDDPRFAGKAIPIRNLVIVGG